MASFLLSNGSGWNTGLASLADAIAQAPANRARARQMELDAANQAAQQAIAQAKEARDAEAYNYEKTLREANRRKLGYETEGAGLTNDRTRIGITQDQTNLDQDVQLFPHELRTKKSEADIKTLEAGTAGMEYDAIPGRRAAAADLAISDAFRRAPAWPGAASGHGGGFKSALSTDPTLPGMEDAGMNFPGIGGDTAAIDALMKRKSIADAMAPRAYEMTSDLIGSDSDTGKWVDTAGETLFNAYSNELGAPATTAEAESAFPGQSGENSARRVMTSYELKKQQGQPTTAQEDIDYKYAYQALFGEKIERVLDPATNQYVNVPVQVTPPAGTPLPGGVPTGVSPVPAPVSPGVVTGAAGRPDLPPAVPAVAATGTAQPQATPGTGAKPFEPTEGQATIKFRQTLQAAPLGRMLVAAGYNPETRQVSGSVPTWFDQMLAGSDITHGIASPEARAFTADAFKAVDPILRMMTGAAMNESEMPRYLNSYLPKSTDTPEAKAAKFEDLIRAQAMLEYLSTDPRFRDNLMSNDPAKVMLANQQYKDALTQNPGLDVRLSGGPSAAAAGVPAYPAAPGAEVIDDETKALVEQYGTGAQ